MGAWIETEDIADMAKVILVAPYVGAWIETNHHEHHQNQIGVAPYVGAWIETSYEYYWRAYALSHPTWVRGLKLLASES